MAQGKKSIIVYADWINKFEALKDAEAGRLIKHLLRYVNDLDPVAPDRITQLSFIDIEQSLKRDLVKWEDRAERSRKNGKAGGRPEKPRITQQVISEPRKPDSVNVSVSDSVSVNEKENNSFIQKMQNEWIAKNPNYPPDKTKDYPALLAIAKFISENSKIPFKISDEACKKNILDLWSVLCEKIPKIDFYKDFNLSQVEKYIQSIVLKVQNGRSNNGVQKDRDAARSEYANRYG